MVVPELGIRGLCVHAAIMTGTSINLAYEDCGPYCRHDWDIRTISFLVRTEILSDNLSEASCLEATLSLHMLSNTVRLL